MTEVLAELPIVTTRLQEYADLCAANPDTTAYLALRWLKPLGVRDPTLAAISEGIETLSVGRAQIEPDQVLIGDRITPEARAGRMFDQVIPRSRILDAAIYPLPGEITTRDLFSFMMGTTGGQGRPR